MPAQKLADPRNSTLQYHYPQPRRAAAYLNHAMNRIRGSQARFIQVVGADQYAVDHATMASAIAFNCNGEYISHNEVIDEHKRREPVVLIPVTVEWTRRQAVFIDKRFSRRHRWLFDGGAEVAASSSPHIVPVPMSDAAAVDPEEAFVASLSSCHMLCFLSVAAKQGFCVERYVDQALGEMGKNDAGKTVMKIVRLRPLVEWDQAVPDDSVIAEMHAAAHTECYIANSVKTLVLIEH